MLKTTQKAVGDYTLRSTYKEKSLPHASMCFEVVLLRGTNRIERASYDATIYTHASAIAAAERAWLS